MMEEKKALRKHIAQLKGSMKSSDLSVASGQLFAHVEQLPLFQEAHTVLCYYSLPDEVQTHDFVERWKERKRILLPPGAAFQVRSAKAGHKKTRAVCNAHRSYYTVQFPAVSVGRVPAEADNLTSGSQPPPQPPPQ